MFAFFFLRYKDKKFFLKTQSFKKGNIKKYQWKKRLST